MALHLCGDDGTVGLALGLGLEGAHHLADAAGAEFGGAGGGDGLGDQGDDLLLGELLGEVLGQDVRLGLFLVGELGTVGLAVAVTDSRRFFASALSARRRSRRR